MTKFDYKKCFIPCSPAGTILMHLASENETEAWGKLLNESKHTPHKDLQWFKKRGYKVSDFTGIQVDSYFEEEK